MPIKFSRYSVLIYYLLINIALFILLVLWNVHAIYDLNFKHSVAIAVLFDVYYLFIIYYNRNNRPLKVIENKLYYYSFSELNWVLITSTKFKYVHKSILSMIAYGNYKYHATYYFDPIISYPYKINIAYEYLESIGIEVK